MTFFIKKFYNKVLITRIFLFVSDISLAKEIATVKKSYLSAKYKHPMQHLILMVQDKFNSFNDRKRFFSRY